MSPRRFREARREPDREDPRRQRAAVEEHRRIRGPAGRRIVAGRAGAVADAVSAHPLGRRRERKSLRRPRRLAVLPARRRLSDRPGFLDPRVLAQRAAGGSEYTRPPQPDPRLAILDFQRQLAQTGHPRSVLMPTPVKPMISRNGSRPAIGRSRSHVLQNASFEQFKAEMEAGGVLVFDPAPALAGTEAGDRRAAVPRDRHPLDARRDAVRRWAVARIPGTSMSRCRRNRPPGFGADNSRSSNLGDIAVMMRLASRPGRLFAPANGDDPPDPPPRRRVLANRTQPPTSCCWGTALRTSTRWPA